MKFLSAMSSFGAGAFNFGKQQSFAPPANKGTNNTTLQSQSGSGPVTTTASLISFGGPPSSKNVNLN